MMIDEWQARKKQEMLNDDKEIKVKIPLDYHIKLHTVKVIKGQNISETVKAALAHYFQEMRMADAAIPAAPTVMVTTDAPATRERDLVL
ncbi:MAG TPA: hypothetical protein VM889_12735 [Candidatus Thermoplasmatota archaeon]|nr:hypothetical protein [Candidatus Thermoplasmatota archaeon]